MSELVMKSRIRVYSKGQLTLPIRVRALVGIKRADTLDLELLREPSGKWTIVLRPVEEKA